MNEDICPCIKAVLECCKKERVIIDGWDSRIICDKHDQSYDTYDLVMYK